MLKDLTVTDFAIVKTARVEFHPGFNVLTGETGAGKSIMVEAFEVVVGGRPVVEMIRTGCDKAVVEARFDISGNEEAILWLSSAGMEGEEDLILRRVVSRAGKNRVFINGAMATAGQLKELGRTLVDIHGQHESQNLFEPQKHISFLDRFLSLTESVERYRAVYYSYIELKRELKSLTEGRRELARKKDLLAFQAGEIENAALIPGEDTELARERKILANAGRLVELANSVTSLLEEGESPASSTIRAALRSGEAMAEIDSGARPVAELLASTLIQLEEATTETRSYAETLEHEPERLELIAERLNLIGSLKKKYGDTIEDIVRFGGEAREELESIDLSVERADALGIEIKKVEEKVCAMALELDKARRSGADRFAGGVLQQLMELDMERAAVTPEFTYEKDDESPCQMGGESVALNSNGIGRMEILFSANPGEALKPLSKIASGGEISRVMLAIKCAMADKQPSPVMVFDEVDTGVGGVTADRIGEKLRLLAETSQVFCVTHLAQVASQAIAHFKVEKNLASGRTAVTVRDLDREGRIHELARMAGGEKASSAARAWAEEALGN